MQYALYVPCESKKLGHFYFYCNFVKRWPILIILTLCYLMTSVWRHLHMKLCSFCIEKHQTSFLQTCGLQTVQISIQLSIQLTEIWAVMQRRVYKTKIHTIDELKQRLIEVWCGLEQSTAFDMAIEQWRGRLRACVRAKRGHFEHSLWTYWLCWFCQPFITFV